MNGLKIFLSITIFFALAFSFNACKKEKDEDNSVNDASFDKSGMLKNIAENIIIPSYTDLKAAVDSLQYYNNQFLSNPNTVTLIALQQKFRDAYSTYQWCSAFEFGPAEDEIIRANFNTFPCDTVQVNNNISSGVYNLGAASNLDAKGFPAIDFLLYGSLHNNDTIVAMFTIDADAANRKNYLSALVNELKSKTDIVNNAWSPSGGNYIATFIGNTGTDAGSSLSLLVNQLNFDFEVLKNFEIGIPLGKQSLGTPFPEKVQAYYSQSSIVLAMQHIKAIENIYLGRSKQGVDGLGLDDYLAHLQSPYNGGLLSDAIKAQLTTAIAKLQLVPDPLSQTIITNSSVVNNAYVELQKQVILFKTEMPSSFGVLITYLDNDGD